MNAKLVNVSTLKPLDEEGVVSVLKATGKAVTIEDHNIIGGLGSAIAETAAKLHPVPISYIGVDDCFAESGKAGELLDAYGMSEKRMEEVITSVAKG